MNNLYFGDNLTVLRESVADASVDLIYLDPPFNSDARYNVLFPSPDDRRASAQAEAFRDTWSWDHEAEWAMEELAREGGPLAAIVGALHRALGTSDLMAYLAMMAVRLGELRRSLKPTGSLYLHCDPTASHYLKVLLDGVFGPANFRNEIIWKRTGAHGSAKRWGPIHDTILFYSASRKFTWNRSYQPHEAGYIKKHYKEFDDRGQFQPITLTGSGVRNGSSGKPWGGIDPTEVGRHWAVPESSLPEWFVRPPYYERLSVQDKLGLLEAAGLIWWPADGDTPRFKLYASAGRGNPIQDLVLDISPLTARSAERIGYPTQKPSALLERIVSASSNSGDVVLDPFCGCGTSIHAAHKLGRSWIGIDIAYHAVEVISSRLEQSFGLKPGVDYAISGRPSDLMSAERLAEKDKYQFQWWANYLVGVQQMREVRRGRDQGIDGEIFFPGGPGRGFSRILTSVKGGRNVGSKDVRDFRGVIEREHAEGGLFICLRRPTADMRSNAASAGFFTVGSSRFPRMQIVSIEEWFEDNARPILPSVGHVARQARPHGGEKPRRRSADKRQGELLLPIPGTEGPTVTAIHVNPHAAVPLPSSNTG